MADELPGGEQDEVLELVLEDDAPPAEDQPEDDAPEADDDAPVISFADEADEEVDDTPLVKKLRDQIRERDRKIAQMRRAPETVDDDPEPVVPPVKRAEDFDYDYDRFDAYQREREQAVEDRAEWRVRDAQRKSQAADREQQQARQIEQQRRALGVGDYEDRAAKVKDALTEQQLAILISAADNPAQLIYALGRSTNKLDIIAGEGNLARFAAMVGKLEKDIKVTKRNKAPAPEARVRGATASTTMASDDKELERLERDADRTGDRSAVIRYKRQMRERQAA